MFKKRKGIPKVTRIVSFHRETHHPIVVYATEPQAYIGLIAAPDRRLCFAQSGCSDEQPASLECS